MQSVIFIFVSSSLDVAQVQSLLDFVYSSIVEFAEKKVQYQSCNVL